MSLESTRTLIDGIELFAILPESLRTDIARLATFRELSPGGSLFREREPGTFTFVVERGWIRKNSLCSVDCCGHGESTAYDQSCQGGDIEFTSEQQSRSLGRHRVEKDGTSRLCEPFLSRLGGSRSRSADG
jgi:hypothetical protein